jgi:hypothetical protein
MNANVPPNATGDQPEVVNIYNTDSGEAVGELIESLPTVVKESKSGYKTTEFWITIATALAVTLEAVPVPAKYEGIVVAVVGALYVISRGLAKQGVPVVEPQKDE